MDELLPIASRLVALGEPRFATFLLLGLRVSIVLAVAPWPGPMIPLNLRALLGVLIAGLLAATIEPSALFSGTERLFVVAAIHEVIYGGALAFGAWFAIGAIVLCGQIAGLQMGFGLRDSLDPSFGGNMNAVASIAVVAWMPMALELGLHHHLLRAMSFAPSALTPVGDISLLDRAMVLGHTMVNESSHMFALALVGAGPVFAMAMLAHAGLGAISRAVPNAMIIGEALGGAAVLGMVAVGISALSWPGLTERGLRPLIEVLGG